MRVEREPCGFGKREVTMNLFQVPTQAPACCLTS